MLLAFHVTCAILSLIVAAVGTLSPTVLKIKMAGGLTAMAVATGTYLIIHLHTNMLKSCATGLIYLAIAFGLLAAARWRLAVQSSKEHK